MIKLSVSIFGKTIGYMIYTVSREPIRLPEIQYLVFGIFTKHVYKRLLTKKPFLYEVILGFYFVLCGFNDLRYNDIPGLTMGMLLTECKVFPVITIKSKV